MFPVDLVAQPHDWNASLVFQPFVIHGNDHNSVMYYSIHCNVYTQDVCYMYMTWCVFLVTLQSSETCMFQIMAAPE